MEYILIIVYLWTSGPIATTAEFKTKAACEAARTEVLKRKQPMTVDLKEHVFCVPKG